VDRYHLVDELNAVRTGVLRAGVWGPSVQGACVLLLVCIGAWAWARARGWERALARHVQRCLVARSGLGPDSAWV